MKKGRWYWFRVKLGAASIRAMCWFVSLWSGMTYEELMDAAKDELRAMLTEKSSGAP